MNITVTAYPSKLKPHLPRVKFKGLSERESKDKHQELIELGYQDIKIFKTKK
jgi:hypothetical protein